MDKDFYYVIGSSSAPGKGSGINAYALELVNEFIRNRKNVIYISPAPEDKSWIKNNNIIHIPTERIGSQSKQAIIVYMELKKRKIKSIINNDNPILQALAPALKVPIISVAHCESRTIATLIKKNNLWIDYTVMISDDMRSNFVDKKRLLTERCPIIYNGLHSETSTLNKKAKHSGKLSIVFSGGGYKNKGAHIMLQSIKNYEEKWNKYELNWFGYVNDNIKKEIEKYNFIKLHDRLSRNEYLLKIKNSDIFCLPSKEEGCPMALLEAMSMGLIPIVSDGRGAMTHIVQHGQNGYVIGLKKWPEQILNVIADLDKSPKKIELLSQNTFRTFREKFSINQTYNSIVRLTTMPTVNRSLISGNTKLTIFKWHRLPWEGEEKISVIGKIIYRLGIIFTEKTINVDVNS